MKVFVSGFFNRGQQNEYVELEAAAKSSLEGLMLMRYLYGKDYLPIQSETRVFLFPDINLRKGNLVRLYTFHHPGKKKEKDETLGKTVYNFSWNLDRTMWEGTNVEAQVMDSGDSVGLAPYDSTSDSVRITDDHQAGMLDPDSLLANMMLGAIDGRVNVISEDGKAKPLEITGVPPKVKEAISEGDYYKAYTLMLAESAR